MISFGGMEGKAGLEVLIFFIIFTFKNVFVFGCTGSSLLCRLSLVVAVGAFPLHCTGFSFSASLAVEHASGAPRLQ